MLLKCPAKCGNVWDLKLGKLKQFIHFNYFMSKMLNHAIIFDSGTHEVKIINIKTIRIPELITLYVIISQAIKIIFQKVHSL